MAFYFFIIFSASVCISTIWWIATDFFEKRQTYWYNSWQRCSGERGHLQRENFFLRQNIENLEYRIKNLKNEKATDE